QSSGWINKLSSDWEQIIEYKDGEKNIRPISERELKKRVTFAQSKDKYGHKAYRFIGVFEPYPDNGERVERAYKRVNTKLDLTQFK
ncbi:MAG: hypothetical protein SO262_00595, partial [Lentihominibacter sp.]|nr:hypothetical protein [Lentihominibacter sp.]